MKKFTFIILFVLIFTLGLLGLRKKANPNPVDSNPIDSTTIDSTTIDSNTIDSNTIDLNTIDSNSIESNPADSNTIELPLTDNISSVEIPGGIQDTIITDKERIASIIQKINEATLTSKKSIQDVPTVSVYTRVDFVSDGNISSIFIYQENSEWYIEQPYNGIYRTDENVLKLLQND